MEPSEPSAEANRNPPDPTGAGDAKAALAQLRTMFREVQEVAHIGSWEWEMGTGVVTWSEEQFRLYGEDGRTYVPSFEGYLSHLREPVKSEVLAMLQATLEGKGGYSIEHEIVWADGSVRFVAEKGKVVYAPDGKPLRMMGTTQDITERRASEQALQAKQRELEVQTTFLKCIVENIPSAIFIKDIHSDFRVTLWNKAAEDMFQVRREDMIGKTAHDLWPKEQADLYLAADWEVIRSNTVVNIAEEPSQTKDRGTIYVNTIKLPLITSEGSEPEYLLAISNDVTRHKQVTAELKAAKEAAESANRAKSEFLAVMSHEIRTPMNGVIGMANLLRNTPLTEDQAEMVGTMELSGKILLGLIDDILDYSKIEADRMDVDRIPFRMEDAVTEIADLMRPQAEKKGLALTVSFPQAAPLTASGDPIRLRQVLMNLIGNAIKFTRAGKVAVSARAEGDRIRADIADTGIGIAEETRSRLFGRFSQADASTTREFGGTGLGLAISKRLMELMGGSLDFTSVAGQGSTFFLTLPATADAPPPRLSAAAERAKHNPAERVSLGLRVLLAEDNIVNQKVGAKILASLGCTVDLAPTGNEAVALAMKNPYDIVLMDIHMPEKDGLGAVRDIRAWEASRPEAGRRLPIIALSASAMQNDRLAAREAGMDGFLTKPILADELTRVLAGIIKKN